MNEQHMKAAFWVFMVIIAIICIVNEDTPEDKPTAKPVVQESVKPVQSSNNQDAQVKARIKAKIEAMPGSSIVIVRGDTTNGIVVDVDYDMSDISRDSAISYAKDLIGEIMSTNSDVPFSYLSVNCMNGKSPLGVIVQYEHGEYFVSP